MDYYFVENEDTGKMGISAYAFQQIADACEASLLEGEMKDCFALTDGHRTLKNSVQIDQKKNAVKVRLPVFAFKNSDMKKSTAFLQESVYQALYSATEVSRLTVDVEISGVLEQKAA